MPTLNPARSTFFSFFLTPLVDAQKYPHTDLACSAVFMGHCWGNEKVFFYIYNVLSFLETILWVLKVLPSTILWKHHMGKTDSDAFTNTLKRVLDSIVIASNLVPRSKRLSRLFVWMRKYCSKYLPPATILPGGGVVRDKWNIFRVH